VASAGFLLSRGNLSAGSRFARPVGAVALALIVVGAVISAVSASGGQLSDRGALLISATNARYSTTTLVGHSGQVTVDFTNNDLFWHTFTVPALGVNIDAPVKAHRRLTFTARPGTYEFFCAIPGHRQIGMHGTLVIH
jgi:plastocyanin